MVNRRDLLLGLGALSTTSFFDFGRAWQKHDQLFWPKITTCVWWPDLPASTLIGHRRIWVEAETYGWHELRRLEPEPYAWDPVLRRFVPGKELVKAERLFRS